MKRKRLEELVIDPTDPDLRPERRCRHRAGDPDCDCHPEDETEDDDADDPDGTTDEQDAEVVAVVETLPAPLTSAQVTERELRRLEAERVEALRPEREKIAGWARDTIDGMPSTPDIKDADLIAAMRATVEMVRDSLLDLEASMKG